MALAFDAATNATPGTGNLSWTHTPSGTPRAVLVFVVQNVGTGDEVTGVTYGGTAMAEVSGSPNLHTSGEPGAVYAYFLGSSIPTGNQTVQVSVNGTGSTKAATAISYTAAYNTEIADTDASVNGDSVTNPSATLNTPVSIASAVAIGFHSGQQQPTGITPLSGWTSQQEHDFGSQNAGVYTRDSNGTGGDITVGWTQTAEDAVAIAVAVREVALMVAPSADTVEVGETLTVWRILWIPDLVINELEQPQRADEVTLGESATVNLGEATILFVAPTDDITLEEAATVTGLIPALLVSDDAALAEGLDLQLLPILLLISDDVLTEDVLAQIGTGLFINTPPVSEEILLDDWNAQEIVGVSTDVEVDFTDTDAGSVVVHLIYQGNSNRVRAVLATNSSGRTVRFTITLGATQEFVNIPDGTDHEELALTGGINIQAGVACDVRVA